MDLSKLSTEELMKMYNQEEPVQNDLSNYSDEQLMNAYKLEQEPFRERSQDELASMSDIEKQVYFKKFTDFQKGVQPSVGEKLGMAAGAVGSTLSSIGEEAAKGVLRPVKELTEVSGATEFNKLPGMPQAPELDLTMDENAPGIAKAAGFLSEYLLPGGVATKAVSTIPQLAKMGTTAKAAIEGIIGGGLSGYLQDVETQSERLQNAGTGAVLGGILNPLGNMVTSGASKLFKNPLSQADELAQKGATVGQATGNTGILATENKLADTAFSGMKSRFVQQADEVAAEARKVLNPQDKALADIGNDLIENVSSNIKPLFEKSYSNYNNLYKEAGEKFGLQYGSKDLNKIIKDKIIESGDEVLNAKLKEANKFFIDQVLPVKKTALLNGIESGKIRADKVIDEVMANKTSFDDLLPKLNAKAQSNLKEGASTYLYEKSLVNGEFNPSKFLNNYDKLSPKLDKVLSPAQKNQLDGLSKYVSLVKDGVLKGKTSKSDSVIASGLLATAYYDPKLALGILAGGRGLATLLKSKKTTQALISLAKAKDTNKAKNIGRIINAEIQGLINQE